MVAPVADLLPSASSGVPRDTFLPVRQRDLLDYLCRHGALSGEHTEAFERLCGLLAAQCQWEYDGLLERVETAYAPFDPDGDSLPLRPETARRKQEKLNELFNEISWLMAHANFRHLSGGDLEPVLEASSAWGVRVDVDFRLFERLAIFVRGDASQKRQRRHPWRPWQYRETDLPIYRRVVMVLKLRRSPRLGGQVDPEKVYLQLFKDIPKLDLKMLLPGARARISHTDRGKMGVSVLTGLGIMLWRLIEPLAGGVADLLLWRNPVAVWGLATGTLGYGVRSYYGYQQTKQRYALSLTQLLYFQNLDTNAGVLQRVLREAEEQECREATLAYYVLWRSGEPAGLSAAEVQKHAQQLLERVCGVRVCPAAAKTLENLCRLGVAVRQADRYCARPPREATEALQRRWTSHYGTPRVYPGEIPPSA